ncbi:MAG: hypothetical protein JXA25_04245 [Anaerolineales bacterium]|nr:hypothetical protein [Anaerolineales bacterium]
MKKRDTLIFWLGGVFIPRVDECVLRFLDTTDRLQYVFYRRELRALYRELSLGKLSPRKFCDKCITLLSLDMAPARLESEILAAMVPDQNICRLFRKIRPEYLLWMICDLPEKWFMAVYEHSDLMNLFPWHHCLPISSMGVFRIMPDVLNHMVSAANSSVERTVFIDSDSANAVQATRMGIPSLIYAYPGHLEHALKLQKIIPPENEVLHPTTSERVISP